MKTYGILCFVLALAMFAAPVAAFDFSNFSTENVKENLSLFSDSQKEKTKEDSKQDTVRVLQAASGNVTEVGTIEYLVGCLACEMPPNYSDEALKAQAVAAYTNLIRLKETPDGKAENADITDDTGKHQGYYDEATRREKWGEKYDVYQEKFTAAVQAVSGQTLTYDGKPVTAAYFSLCAGRTESAQVIWGGDIPYLQSVTSTGDRLSPNLQSDVQLSAEEVRQKLSAEKEILLGEDPAGWFGEVQYAESASGAAAQVTVGGKTLTGQQCRALLGLPSPAFAVEYKDGAFSFTVQGKGHFVGMSQYGADYMARQGADYKEILAHYYPGTVLANI